MAKPSPLPTPSARLLVLELWGLGDLALAMPFLREATRHARVTLVAKPHAGPLVRRFAPEVELIEFTAPWTAFRGKYRLHRWPWRPIADLVRNLRASDFDCGVSVRRDPRDHALLFLAGARRRFGFPRRGSRILLTDRVAEPVQNHRANYWHALAGALGWEIPGRAAPAPVARDASRRIVIHAGAGHPSRHWPRDRFAELAQRLRTAGWDPLFIDEESDDLDGLLGTLAAAARFIGNDSGPGHLAALLNVPTFTIFGPSLPELFSPSHPGAAWVEGAACRYRPCWDDCRFAEPRCIQAISVDAVWMRVQEWLKPR